MAAWEQGLKLLKPGGMMSLCIYSGGDTGFEERDALLAFLRELPSRQYTVIQTPYYNRSGHPPLPVFCVPAEVDEGIEDRRHLAYETDRISHQPGSGASAARQA